MMYEADGEAMREYSSLVAQIARLDYEAERIGQARAQAIEAVKAWEEAHVEKEDTPIKGVPLDDPSDQAE